VLLFDQAVGEAENEDFDGCLPRRQETRAEWLKRAILPHETSLRKMLCRKYPGIDRNEVLQTTYLKLMAVPEVDHIKNPKWYFFTTAQSVVMNQVRHDQVVEIENVDFNDVEWAADEPSIERVVDSRLALQFFYNALQGLPPRQREAVELRRIEGLRTRPTAVRMGLSESSVEKLQLNAMRTLQAAMDRL
jgi:RNA polymerase sigma-70 factor (ECF subfamily)